MPSEISKEPGKRTPPGGLPDGRVASGSGDIREAWYGAPTERYAHAVLGDAIEAGELVVRTRSGTVLTLSLPENQVFEDRTPRLADLDGDGLTEVITIRAGQAVGAAVVIYGIREGRLVELAATDPIGRANRWLNIAAIHDLDGRPGLEIAYVRTPHIGGTLIFLSFDGRRLKQLAAMEGFSNHVIGSRELRLSAVADIDGDGRLELALPSKDRRTLRIVGWGPSGPVNRETIPLPTRIDKAIVLQNTNGFKGFVLGLDDGRFYEVSR
ncbi:hypothetical protein [Hoeflea prorocentri]|uniref:VCBS repeat-containing protein n=1 Tax=Hoeflea prorocentri TaxID=1922333 RepID=A0A9X3ZHL9_9HYPH|nr:hypothetical protein [Hoeflea prorocentri]MCY6381058.1 hypothetical protein [Hoeflea prorocentri]MDA5398858.1 hypothetical protein [Hoeflea prorocentri]